MPRDPLSQNIKWDVTQVKLEKELKKILVIFLTSKLIPTNKFNSIQIKTVICILKQCLSN